MAPARLGKLPAEPLCLPALARLKDSLKPYIQATQECLKQFADLVDVVVQSMIALDDMQVCPILGGETDAVFHWDHVVLPSEHHAGVLRPRHWPLLGIARQVHRWRHEKQPLRLQRLRGHGRHIGVLATVSSGTLDELDPVAGKGTGLFQAPRRALRGGVNYWAGLIAGP